MRTPPTVGEWMAATVGTRMGRRGFLGSLTSLAAMVGCVAREKKAGSHVRVMTYNLHHGEGVDGRLDVERIARVIREARPDLVALQEVDRLATRTGRVDQGAEYRRLTGMEGWYGAAMPFQGGEYGQVLLSRWPLEGPRVVRLPGSAGREPRIAVVARVRVPGVGGIQWAGCHLDASRGDEDRWEQVAALDRELGGAGGPVLLAGDFNDTPASRSMARLLGPEGRWEDLGGAGPGGGPTIPAEAPRSRIDFVLGTPRGVWRTVESVVVAEPVASDHRPVVVTVERAG